MLSKRALKDYRELERQGLKDRVDAVLSQIAENPFSEESERLKGDYRGMFSRRLNKVDRIVYEMGEDELDGYEGVVRVLRLRTHYQGIIPTVFLR